MTTWASILSSMWLSLGIRLGRGYFYRLARHSAGLLDCLLGDLDDRANEQALRRQLLRTLGSLLVVGGGLLGLLGGAWAIWWGLVGPGARPVAAWGWGLAMLAGLLPWLDLLRRRRSAYPELARLWHELILDHPALHQRIAQVDRRFRRSPVPPAESHFVVVSGLARAGTTSLTQQLHARGTFAALTYQHMPLLLAPHLWPRLHQPGRLRARPRAHGDALAHDLRSVEAFEECFFRTQLGEAYCRGPQLLPHAVSIDTYQAYLRYQQALRPDERHGYLAKNNLLLLRYPSLRAHNPDFVAIFLFREPLAQAHSLWQQHLRFTAMQQADPFVLRYMDWLGHHEFGRHHRPMHWPDDPPLPDSPQALTYWLALWQRYHRHLLDVSHPQTVLIDYADYVATPQAVLARLSAWLPCPLDLQPLPPYPPRPLPDHDLPGDQLAEARDLYQRLRARRLVP